MVGVTWLTMACAATAQTIEYIGEEESLSLEHQTRYSRLKRFVEQYDVTPVPTFQDYVIPAREMPADFRYDTPVLRIVFPENTFFATGRAEILPTAYPIILAMAKMLDGDVPDVAVFIAGHTDNRGGEDYNHNLSIARAQAVAKALRESGADKPQLFSVGFGESLPLYANLTPEQMGYNRRVEFLLSAKLESAALWLKDQLSLACTGGSASEKLSCLSSLKVRRSYTALEVPRIQRARVDARRTVVEPAIAPRKVARVEPKRVVISLTERRYVIDSVEH